MIVSFKCVNKKSALGWSEYVTSDKKNKNQERENHFILENDKRDIAQAFIKRMDYKTCATNIMISFAKDEADRETRQKAVNEYLEYLFNAFDNDEYIYNIVEHNDTENPHYHIQLVKLNLRTLTQLKIYEHKQDLKFQNALCEYLGEKYNLKIPFKNAEPDKNKRILSKYQGKVKRFDNLSENNLKTLNIMQLKIKLNEIITNKIINNELQNYNDTLDFLDYLGFKVVTKSNQGYDGYITLVKKEIDNPKQTDKIKLYGAYYDYEYTNEPTRQFARDIDTSNNQSIRATNSNDGTRMQELYNQLSKYNTERNERLRKRYKRPKEQQREFRNNNQANEIRTSREITRDFKQYGTNDLREHKRENEANQIPSNYFSNTDIYDNQALHFLKEQLKTERERNENARNELIQYATRTITEQRENLSKPIRQYGQDLQDGITRFSDSIQATIRERNSTRKRIIDPITTNIITARNNIKRVETTIKPRIRARRRFLNIIYDSSKQIFNFWNERAKTLARFFSFSRAKEQEQRTRALELQEKLNKIIKEYSTLIDSYNDFLAFTYGEFNNKIRHTKDDDFFYIHYNGVIAKVELKELDLIINQNKEKKLSRNTPKSSLRLNR